jgi:HK97 family phage major capsid protein
MKHWNLRSTAATGRGLLAVRAEAQPIKPVSIDALAGLFEEFKAAHTQQLNGKADAVVDEKVTRIDAELNRVQGVIEEMGRQIAASKLGGGGAQQPRDPEYSQQFAAYFKRGEVTAKLEDVRAAATKTDSEGGYLAPVEWDRTISKRQKQVSPMRQHSSVISISGAGFKKAYSDRNVGSGWVGETAARPATTTPGLTTLDFGLGEVYANPAASQGLIDDAEINIEEWLADEVSVEFDRQEGIAFLSGNGVNKPHGVLTYVTGGEFAGRHPFGPIEAVNSGAAAGVTGDGLIDITTALQAEFAPNAKFFMNRASTGAFRKLKNADGAYLWQPSIALGVPATLLGEEVVDMPGMPAVGAGAVPLLYGDMAETYQVIDRIGIRVLRDPYTNKPFVHFYTTKRVGGGVKNPDAMKALRIGAAA